MKLMENYNFQEVADDDGDVRCGTYLLHKMYRILYIGSS